MVNKMHRVAKTLDRVLFVAAASALLLAAGCGGSEPEPTKAPEPAAAAVEPTKVPANIVEKGKAVYNQYGCQACHAIRGFAEGQVGPELTNLYASAQKTIASPEYKSSAGKATTVEQYIRESILNPNAYVVPQCPTGPCPQGVMIQNFEQQISSAELEALIGYLMTLGR